MIKKEKKSKRNDINDSSILLIYTNTGRQGSVARMTFKAIVSARLSPPILGVGMTMVHWKMEYGSKSVRERIATEGVPRSPGPQRNRQMAREREVK